MLTCVWRKKTKLCVGHNANTADAPGNASSAMKRAALRRQGAARRVRWTTVSTSRAGTAGPLIQGSTAGEGPGDLLHHRENEEC